MSNNEPAAGVVDQAEALEVSRIAASALNTAAQATEMSTTVASPRRCPGSLFPDFWLNGVRLI